VNESNSQAGTSFVEAQSAFLSALRQQVERGTKSEDTVWSYRHRLAFFHQNMQPDALAEVDDAFISRYLGGLRSGSLPHSRKAASEAYVANHWRHLNGFFRWCRQHGYALHPSLLSADSPSRALANPPLNVYDFEPKPWTSAESSAIREVARAIGSPGLPSHALAILIVTLLFDTGIALRELAKLNIDDIRDDAIEVSKPRLVRGQPIMTKRTVPLNVELRPMLRYWIDSYRPSSPSSRLLISPRTGQPLSERGIQAMLTRIHHLAGLKGGAQRYRDTYAVAYIEKYPSKRKELAEALGYGDLQMVSRFETYVQRKASEARDPFA
jgi:site-specific recombinase XerD